MTKNEQPSQMTKSSLITRAEFQNKSKSEQRKYLNRLFDGTKEHLIYGIINGIDQKKMTIEPRYLLVKDSALPYDVFLSDHHDMIYVYPEGNGGVTNFVSFCDERHLEIGAEVVCRLIVPNNDRRGKNIISVEPQSIRNDVILLVGVDVQQKRTFLAEKAFVATTESGNAAGIFLGADRNATMAFLDKHLTKTRQELEAERENLNRIQKESADAERKRDEAKQALDGISEERTKQETKLKKDIEDKKHADQEKWNQEFAEKKAKETKAWENEQQRKREAFTKELQAEAQQYTRILNLFHAMPKPPQKGTQIPSKSFDAFNDLLAYAQGFLRYHEIDTVMGRQPIGLVYRQETLAEYFLALQTQQLILLVGHSGTGKSSLARYFPTIFGFEEAKIIPVQSNWNDKGDLLGYYNPIDKAYVATPFLDALLRYCRLAEDHPENLYFLCLDEMNLAHVEYYFAEFLSKLQEPVPEIRLYSDAITEDIRRELFYNGFTEQEIAHLDADKKLSNERIRALSMEERRYYIDLCRKAEMLSTYPATFCIPHNVKFVGTLNQDETTLDLSPKVLDRSLVIRVEHSAENIARTEGETYKQTTKYRPLASFTPMDPKMQVVVDRLWNHFAGDMAIPYSPRLRHATFLHPEFPLWSCVMGGKTAADCFIAMAALPRMRMNRKDFDEKKARIQKFLDDYPICSEIFEEVGLDGPFDFWKAVHA